MHNELYLTYTQLSKEELNREFVSACVNGDVKAINYLLTTKQLGHNASIDFNDHAGLICACMHDRLDAVKFLLTAKNLKQHSDIHARDDAAFKCACSKEYYEIIEYLINDFKIEETEAIKEHLEKHPNPVTKSMFLNRSLEQTLTASEGKKNRAKKI